MTIWSTIPLLALAICAAWLFSEIAVGRLTRSKADSASALDRSSLKVLWLTIMPSTIIGCFLGLRGIGYVAAGASVVSYCGLVLILLGLVFRWTAMISLRKYFTSNVSIKSEHQLVTSGLYSIVRHPTYTGSLLSFAGLGLTFANWLSTAVIFIPILSAFLYRIKVEERALAEHFGESYAAYRRKVKCLFPPIY